MVEMVDVGEKMGNTLDVPESKQTGEDSKHYPSLYLSTKQLPGLKGKNPGEKGLLQVEYEVKGLSLRKTKDKEEESNYDLEIHKIGLAGSVDKEGEEEEKKKLGKLRKNAKDALSASY